MMVVKSNLVPRLFSVFFSVAAITLWPFIFVRKHPSFSENKILINHETIHIKQYNELLVIGFLVLYLCDWVRGLIKYKDPVKAYNRIRFEQEAYGNQKNMAYLQNRSRFAWKKYKV